MSFYNIFSKKKIKEEKIKIIVDHRERNSLVISELIKNGFEIEFKQLPVADYLVKNTAFERKTISDFKSSIINKRIMSQLLELKLYKSYALIIEGIEEKDFYQGTLHENAFRGFVLSVLLDYQVPIIFTLNEKDTVKYLTVFAKKTKSSHTSIRASKIFLTEKEQIQFILEGFPNIGPATAKKLIEKFKTIKNIMNASEEDLKPILGKRTNNFLKIINEIN